MPYRLGKEEEMALNATMNVAGITNLAQSVDTQQKNLSATLNQLMSACQRADEFSGNAAASYDQYLANWHSSQMTMIQSMEGAVSLLRRYAQWLADADDHTGFNVQ